MKEKHFIQVGVTALRTPTGKHYPPVPLYVETDELNTSGLAPCEEKMLNNFAGFIMEKYSQKIQDEKGTTINESIVSG